MRAALVVSRSLGSALRTITDTPQRRSPTMQHTAATHYDAGLRALALAETHALGSPAAAQRLAEAATHFEAAAMLVESHRLAVDVGILDADDLDGCLPGVVGPSSEEPAK